MDGTHQSRPFAATVRLYLLNWVRSRAPLGIVAFVGVLCAYDAMAPARDPSPWGLLTFAGAWSGFLAAYDTYERLRAEGALRLMLLHGQSRIAFAGGMAIGGIVPPGAPEAVRALAQLVWNLIPTIERFRHVLAGTDVAQHVLMQVVQLAGATAGIVVALQRPALLARQRVAE